MFPTYVILKLEFPFAIKVEEYLNTIIPNRITDETPLCLMKGIKQETKWIGTEEKYFDKMKDVKKKIKRVEKNT